MAEKKITKGSRLICSPCGREIVVTDCGITKRTLWCCGRSMGKSSVTKKKTIKKRITKKK